MRSFVFVVGVAGVLVVGCAPLEEAPVGVKRAAIGEPQSGFPTALERLGIMAINRARSDPSTVKGAQSATYAARPPVLWSYDLSRSSRFHANNLNSTDVSLMHTSPCTLKTTVSTANCDGTQSCACNGAVGPACVSCASAPAVNNCGTDPFVRIGYFISGTNVTATGEVASAGYPDPMAVVDGWMDEPASPSNNDITDGHRRNLTDQGITSNVMGYGRTAGQCFQNFDISDSGFVSNLEIPQIPTAAVNPASGSAGSFTFYATWADSNGAPMALNVVVDGTCVAMTKELGQDTLNATYKVSHSLAAGCHNYYVLGKDSTGTDSTFPTTGAITLSVGGTSCSSDFLAQAPTASCSGAVVDMSSVQPDDAGANEGDLAGRDLASAGDLAGGGNGNAGDMSGASSGSDCSAAPGTSPPTGTSVFALAALGIFFASRRRG